MEVWIVTLLQGMMRLFQWTWFKFNFFPFSCETQSSLSSLAPCQTLPRYAASLKALRNQLLVPRPPRTPRGSQHQLLSPEVLNLVNDIPMVRGVLEHQVTFLVAL